MGRSAYCVFFFKEFLDFKRADNELASVCQRVGIWIRFLVNVVAVVIRESRLTAD